MLINETTINCCKPKRFIPFTGESSEKASRRIRSKHYGQMSDDVLELKSVLDAHKEVQKSGKMRLFKALPAITTGILGVTIGLTQPGKLAAKAGAGLGFLALSEFINNGTNFAIDKIRNAKENNESNDSKKMFLTIAKVAAGFGAIALGATLLKNTKLYKTANSFAKKEIAQLANEINNTKLAKSFNNKVTPFAAKHAKGLKIVSAVAPYGVIAASALTQAKLANSISNDIKQKASENYIEGKTIQAIARAHYESIDAPEMV